MLDDAAETALISAVRAAARFQIIPRYRALTADEVRTKGRPDDLVTEADLTVERLLTEQIPSLLPGALVLGEEAAAHDPGLIARAVGHETCVIVDPVDGTWNFANGLSVFGTILAVLREGQVVWGLLYDPLMDDWIVARKGRGVHYIRPGAAPIPCQLGAATPLAARLGLMAPALFSADQRVGLATRAAASFDRTMGLRCSCHEYRLMLRGSASWSLSASPMPWDHAAGVLAVTELGGHAAFTQDGPPYAPHRIDSPLLVARDRWDWAEIHAALLT